MANRYQAKATPFSLAPEGAALLDAFESEIYQGLATAEDLCRHVVWLPDLARRIALLFHILSKEGGETITAAAAEKAVVVTKWLGRQHLRSVASKRGVSGPVAKTDFADKADVMYRKIRQKGPVSARELWRSYDSPKADWFNPVLESLISTGRVRRDDKDQLLRVHDGSVGGAGGDVCRS